MKEIIIEKKIIAWSPNFEESNTNVPKIIAKEYFIKIGKGDKTTIKEEYNSDNTNRLDVAQMKELLLKLPEVRQDLGL